MEMANFTRESELLAPLQTFERDAFVGDERVPQELCNFVLTLALIYNDCKDGIFSNMMLTGSKPKGQVESSRDWGTYNGIKLHYIRLHVALIHELLGLIEENQQIVKHEFFKSVIKKLPKQDRESWNALVSAALQQQTLNSLNRFLLMIRNKVSFHYDPKALYQGFRHHFFTRDAAAELPFISPGTKHAKI